MAKKTKNTGASKPIEAVRHKDKRKNIPTEELRDFVRQDEEAPPAMLYPRDPDLDPQLVWKGKDEQDRAPLEVPVVPIYIQEKIHPQAIIEDFRRTADKNPDNDQQDFGGLFADFNGLPEEFADRVDFYHHEGHWSNRLILGDSLLVMSSLAEKEALKGKVQMIYLDPPYGIKFGSNWQVSTRKRDVKDGKADDMVRQPEQVKAFRDTWKLGIHSYLAYIRDRLVVTRDLLTDSGSIFVQIGDENVHLVRNVLDEVFGSENFVSLVTFSTTSGFESNELARAGDYLLWYGKNRAAGVKYRPLYEEQQKRVGQGLYRFLRFNDGRMRPMTAEEVQAAVVPDGCDLYSPDNMLSQGPASVDQTFLYQNRRFAPGGNSHWKPNFPDGISRLGKSGRLHVAANSLRFVRMAGDFGVRTRNNVWTDTLTGQFTDDKVYVVQTNTKVIERCILMTTDPGDLVLDPTCGSGTTAYVAEQWGRRWITIDSSRVSLTLARTRLMAGRFPYYLLADSAEGVAKEAEITGQMRSEAKTEGDVRRGFVYKRVPHVTLKSIANNEEIDAIHARWQEKLEPLLKALNKPLKTKWREWEVPRKLNDITWDDDVVPDKDLKETRKVVLLIKQWWELRRQRQQEIDASIARRADTEVLYDQPYEDTKRVRVTGPLTVESLSPHRTISVEEKREMAEVGDAKLGVKAKVLGPDQFGQMILENLRTAGVQNTFKGERLKFDSLEPYAGQWIHGTGQYTEKDPSTKLGAGGKVRRAAICIGPEHGTVGPELVKEAAKEAVQGVGFDVLIVCGFAFDPHVSEEAKRYGKLVVLPTRMNPDLAMGDLLKKTGAGNLFMVFGEPDVVVKKVKDGQITVEIKGLDVYDPTTGEIRSSSTDDIACWFIDTNYNGESFFVRHAYFTGADEPYEKLKRALRAEIDEAAWSQLYSTVSRPFDKPDTGKIAVKVINHYGDEVLKVYNME
ncbi:MAG: site-specific DNA-methyltransferase [Phycisphaerae bacterium]|nr:site-specific DNA-methyltransferase [Phycisphaerae bacterium]